MTDAGKYALGTGKNRLGRDGIRTTVSLEERQLEMLEKLRFVKGYRPSEVVQIALESLFSQPLSELDIAIKKKRGQF